jgi:hypothetical protein
MPAGRCRPARWTTRPRTLLGPARELGFTVPIEAAVHLAAGLPAHPTG